MGRKYVAQSPTWIASVPLGDGDGYARSAIKGAKVLVGERLYPVIRRGERESYGEPDRRSPRRLVRRYHAGVNRSVIHCKRAITGAAASTVCRPNA